jgi:hypothetical protein
MLIVSQTEKASEAVPFSFMAFPFNLDIIFVGSGVHPTIANIRINKL